MKICIINNCTRKHKAKGFCNVHFKRNKLGYNMSKPIRARRRKKCTEAECTREHYAKDLCASHYDKSKRVRISTKCKAYEYCGIHSRKDYCMRHTERISKGQSLDLSVNYMVGELNHRWNNGASEYKNHRLFMANGLIRLKQANYTCEECGKKAELAHHKDKTKTNHDVDNLMALCTKCHLGIYHKGAMGRKKKTKSISL